jgi:Periplasmic copper-binding protein (NosD)
LGSNEPGRTIPEESSVSKFTLSLATAGTLLVFGLTAGPANALATRTFVSGTGVDSGTCTRAAPCRNFAYAITQTAAFGEIAVLDTAGYGTLTINKSISIVNPGGVEAGIAAAPGGTAITITGLAAGDIVALRGLTIEGAQSGVKGIVFNSIGALEIDNCVIRDFAGSSGNAIEITPTTGATTFRISNSILAANGHDGILVNPSGSATVQGVIDHVAASGNINNGIAIASAGGAVNVSITNSVVSSNLASGILAASAKVTVSNTTAANNPGGIVANASATIQLTQSLVAGNTTGVVLNGGVVQTYGDNNINFNGTPVSGGSLSAVALQ